MERGAAAAAGIARHQHTGDDHTEGCGTLHQFAPVHAAAQDTDDKRFHLALQLFVCHDALLNDIARGVRTIAQNV